MFIKRCDVSSYTLQNVV